MVDAADLKSASCKGVWVRVPPSAVNRHRRDSKNKTSKTSFQRHMPKLKAHRTAFLSFKHLDFNSHLDFVIWNSGNEIASRPRFARWSGRKSRESPGGEGFSLFLRLILSER
jgi:hypothetical protein